MVLLFSHRGPIAAKPQPNFLATEGTEGTEERRNKKCEGRRAKGKE